jgi:exonuclease III
MTFLFWNVQGLPSKFTNQRRQLEFTNLICKYDFVGMSETWLSKDDVKARTFNNKFNGYTCVFAARGYSVDRGGVAFLYKDKFKNDVQVINEQHGDFIWVKISAKALGHDKDLYICVCYIPPENSSSWRKKHYDPFEILERDVSKYQLKGDVLLGGDFNCRTGALLDFLPASDSVHSSLPNYDQDCNVCLRNNTNVRVNVFGKSLIQLCKTTNMRLVNGRTVGDIFGNFTYYNTQGASAVDYVIVLASWLQSVKYFSVLPFTHMSDHCPIEMHTKQVHTVINSTDAPVSSPPRAREPATDRSSDSKQGRTVFTKYIWSETSAVRFYDALQSRTAKNNAGRFLMTPIGATQSCVNEGVEAFQNLLLDAANVSVRLARVKSSRRKRHWYDASCTALKKSVHTARYRFMKDPFNATLRSHFFALRKKYKKLLNYKEKSYRREILNKLDTLKSSNPSEYWKLIKCLTEDENEKTDNIDSNTWFSHFDKLNTCTTPVSDFQAGIEENVKAVLADSDVQNVLDSDISASELFSALKGLKTNKACGPDRIINELLKTACPVLIDHMLHLCNSILHASVFPDTWRLSFLTPIFKKGDVSDPNNYRGIAISSCLCKLFLTVINTRLCVHFENEKLIDPAQHGFRAGHRTSDNVFIFKTIINKAKSCKKKLFACFIDFSKAFDTVWRTGLVYKLWQNGVRGKTLQLIANMYDKVDYQVKTRNTMSDVIHSNVGVRQGCVCSPTLFNVYLNDLCSYLEPDGCHAPTLDDTKITHLLFADDLVLFSTTKAGLQIGLDKLNMFCTDWRLTLNIAKTKVLVFNCPIKQSINYRFVYGRQSLDVVSTYVYLGITFSSTGSFKQASIDLKNKAMRSWFKIKQSLGISDDTPCSVLVHLFNHVTKQIGLYSSEVWGTEYVSIRSTDLFSKWDKIPCNQLSIKAAKSILGLPRKATNIGSLMELGLRPLFGDVILTMYKYYCRVAASDSDKLIHKAFVEDTRLSNTSVATRCLNSTVLHIHKILNVPVSCDVQRVNMLRVRINNQFDTLCRNECLPTNPITGKSNKLRTYGVIKTKSTFSCYLERAVSFKYRKAIASLRLSVHPLMVEVGRYSGISYEQRYCPACPGDVESECHFLLHCPSYKSERELLLQELYTCEGKCLNITTHGEQYCFLKMLDPSAETAPFIGKYIYDAMQKRKSMQTTRSIKSSKV